MLELPILLLVHVIVLFILITIINIITIIIVIIVSISIRKHMFQKILVALLWKESWRIKRCFWILVSNHYCHDKSWHHWSANYRHAFCSRVVCMPERSIANSQESQLLFEKKQAHLDRLPTMHSALYQGILLIHYQLMVYGTMTL